MKTTKLFLAFLLFASAFTACKKDKESEPEKLQPTIENIELGLGNSEMGIVGEDLHFDADILAGDKIETVQIKIIQKSGETYSKVWTHEITWDQYKGTKNANVHKHFDLPDDAPEGTYDFLIIVNDQNGTKLEVKKNLTIYTSGNLPVNPSLDYH